MGISEKVQILLLQNWKKLGKLLLGIVQFFKEIR